MNIEVWPFFSLSLVVHKPTFWRLYLWAMRKPYSRFWEEVRNSALRLHMIMEEAQSPLFKGMI